MIIRPVLLASVLAVAALAQAQTASAPAKREAVASSPAKKELVASILKEQQQGIEQLARQIVEQPAGQLLQRAGSLVTTRIEADKREAVAREMQADARKYVDDTLPAARQRATALAPSTIGALLEEKMTEAELKEVLATMRSPAWRKFQGLAPEMQKVLGEKLVADIRPQVETNLRALDQSLARRLGLPASASAPASGAAGAGGSSGK